MFEDDIYIQGRIQKANSLKELGINPYGNGIQKEMDCKTFLEKFESLTKLESDDRKDTSVNAQVAGRIKFVRLMGKAAFLKIEDNSGILQIYLSKNELGENFEIFKKYIEVGDIIVAKGFPFVTKTGELSLHALEFKLLTKAISPLPEKYHGLVDIEMRYRQRYVDLIVNPEVKDTFVKRSLILREPIGVVGCVTATTNPVINPMHNSMCALKCGNAVIISPHPRAKRVGARTVELMNEALDRLGMPKNLIQIIAEPTMELSAGLRADDDFLEICLCFAPCGRIAQKCAVPICPRARSVRIQSRLARFGRTGIPAASDNGKIILGMIGNSEIVLPLLISGRLELKGKRKGGDIGENVVVLILCNAEFAVELHAAAFDHCALVEERPRAAFHP